MSSAQWPAEVVRVSHTPTGLRLHYPLLRGWRAALRLALIGGAMVLFALYAAIAYAPAGKTDAALLTLALTAAVVYPVMLFGALFVLVALYAVSSSLTVEVDAASISCVRRVLGFRYSQRRWPTAAITALELETRAAPRGLGGGPRYRLAATQAGGRRLVLAEDIPDETLCRSLQALIETHAHIGRPDR